MNNSVDHQANIDRYISRRVRGVLPRRCSVRPSRDFCQRTMSAIQQEEKRRHWLVNISLISLAVAPLALRELWLFLRHDYFSVSSLPMSRFLLWGYNFFMISAFALYGALTTGLVVAAWLYWARHRRLTQPNPKLSWAEQPLA